MVRRRQRNKVCSKVATVCCEYMQDIYPEGERHRSDYVSAEQTERTALGHFHYFVTAYSRQCHKVIAFNGIYYTASTLRPKCAHIGVDWIKSDQLNVHKICETNICLQFPHININVMTASLPPFSDMANWGPATVCTGTDNDLIALRSKTGRQKNENHQIEEKQYFSHFAFACEIQITAVGCSVLAVYTWIPCEMSWNARILWIFVIVLAFRMNRGFNEVDCEVARHCCTGIRRFIYIHVSNSVHVSWMSCIAAEPGVHAFATCLTYYHYYCIYMGDNGIPNIK